MGSRVTNSESRLDRDDGAFTFPPCRRNNGTPRRSGNIEAPDIADRMARIEAFEFAEISHVGFDRVGQFQQETAAIGGSYALPGGKSLARGRDGAIDIDRGCFGNFREQSVVMRVVDGDEPPSAAGTNSPPMNRRVSID